MKVSFARRKQWAAPAAVNKLMLKIIKGRQFGFSDFRFFLLVMHINRSGDCNDTQVQKKTKKKQKSALTMKQQLIKQNQLRKFMEEKELVI